MYVVGAGGHGRETVHLLREAGLRVDGIVDDRVPDLSILDRLRVIYAGTIEQWLDAGGGTYVIGVGSGRSRETIADLIGGGEASSAVVHPFASVGPDVKLANGAVVFAQATVTTNVNVGDHAHIGRGAAVGHDCELGAFSTVLPLAAISGDVQIGKRATVGSGAVIREGQTIGHDSFVGAGAVVVDDVPSGAVVVGNPARRIR